MSFSRLQRDAVALSFAPGHHGVGPVCRACGHVTEILPGGRRSSRLLLLCVPRAQSLWGLTMQVGGPVLWTGGFQQMAGIPEVVVFPS